MYGIRAARSSVLAPSKAAAIRSTPVAVASATGPLHDLGQVLVAPARQTEHVESTLPRVLQQPGDCVRGLQGGDDPLQPRELSESRQRLPVGDRDVAGAAGIAQISVLRADPRVVEAGGDRVRLEDLALLVGDHG